MIEATLKANEPYEDLVKRLESDGWVLHSAYEPDTPGGRLADVMKIFPIWIAREVLTIGAPNYVVFYRNLDSRLPQENRKLR